MYPPSTGEIRFDGARISRTGDGALADFRRRWVGYVPQSPALLEDLTLLENVVAPHVFLETSMRELKERALALLDRLGLRGKSGVKPPELSGEEKKLAVTVRALVKEPHFLFADEPVAALNNGSAAAVLALFSELQARGSAVVAANRTPLSIKPAPRTYKLLGGRIVEIRGGKY
jgi:ABC-type lipoprotein export system ATPase subunit